MDDFVVNYTPLDIKTFNEKFIRSHTNTLDVVLIFISLLTFLMLGVLLFVVYQKGGI